MKPLLSARAWRQRWLAVAPYVRGDVLDIGCGYTSLPEKLSSEQTYVGVDTNADAVEFSSRRYPQHIFYRRNLGEEPLALGDGRFETVLMMAVIEHLHFPKEALLDIRPYVAEEGLLLITTPSPLGDVVHRVGSRLRLFYPESVVKHIKIFGRRQLIRLLTECGFTVIEFRFFVFRINQLTVCRVRRAPVSHD